MRFEEYEWVAAVIAAHPQQTVAGRTRIQKTLKLLQRLGFPTDYRYTMHHYGPYSEAVQSDISLLRQSGLVKEDGYPTQDGNVCYLIRAEKGIELPDIREFLPALAQMMSADAVVLELAATYDAFREAGADHEEALARLRAKKGEKCADGREAEALALLRKLGLVEEREPALV